MAETLDKALEKIQSARAGIRSEIESISSEIARLEEENRALPNQTASFGEVKKAVLELVETAGARYAETQIRASIIDFAKGAYRDMAELGKYGKTLTLGELDGAIKGEIFPMANTRFLSGGVGQLDDLMLYAVFSGAVQETLSRLIDQLSPTDLGMKNSATDSEMTRDKMNELITSNRAEIDRLKLRKTTLESELKKLS
jgi:hypothetical protein